MSLSREHLAKRIAEVALLRGNFTLRSGRTSTYYLDKYRFETQPDILAALGEMFAATMPPETDRIAGPELGAVALAAAAGMAAGKPFVIVRNKKKDYGSAKQVEGVLNKGDRIVIVEDILTTGGQVIEAAHTLQEMGATVLKIVGVIDRQEGARENVEQAGFVFESLFTVDQLGVTRDT